MTCRDSSQADDCAIFAVVLVALLIVRAVTQ